MPVNMTLLGLRTVASWTPLDTYLLVCGLSGQLMTLKLVSSKAV